MQRADASSQGTKVINQISREISCSRHAYHFRYSQCIRNDGRISARTENFVMATRTYCGSSGLSGRAARSRAKLDEQLRSGVACSRDCASSRAFPATRTSLSRFLHTTIATFACGICICVLGHGCNRWRIWYGYVSLDTWGMHLQNIGTNQQPLAGAILCCTSIAPEQRVCVLSHASTAPLILYIRRSWLLSAPLWARPSSSTSPQT